MASLYKIMKSRAQNHVCIYFTEKLSQCGSLEGSLKTGVQPTETLRKRIDTIPMNEFNNGFEISGLGKIKQFLTLEYFHVLYPVSPPAIKYRGRFD